MMNTEEIVKLCRATAESANEALAWVGDAKNAGKILMEKPALERSLRRAAFQARKLEKSVGRPMCVGVFGPSQCGKSYLVSVLARKSETLTACFNDSERPEIDFIKELNPSGGKESTGLVTRFSIHPLTTPSGYPVALRLLTQTEIVKILANAYGNEGDPEFEQPLDYSVIERVVVAAEAAVNRDYADELREEDIWDLQEYFQRFLKRFDWARKLDAYWDRIAQLAPRLALPQRAELYSLFWGQHKELTSVYLALVSALGRLGFPDDAYCQINALIPSSDSILNVETLRGLFDSRDDSLRVVAGTASADLPRSIVTAITAELRIYAKEKPWGFFDYTDLLDFPGYRSRTPMRLAKKFGEDAGTTVFDMFRRGKVDFLFQRYTADQELTSMLLCSRDSNLEVATLPGVVDEWIGVTHGRTAEDRSGKSILLFFVLTFFDVHLIDRAGDEGGDKKARFDSRIDASLLHPFGSSDGDWPKQWMPGQTFRNCYWIRNPNIKSEGIIEYDKFHELRILPSKVGDLADLKSSYLAVKKVQEHFFEPSRAWDEVLKLNDGGISYLAENLAKVCHPNMKPEQISNRLSVIRKQIGEQLAHYYTSTDLDRRLTERLGIANEILRDIDNSFRTRKRFGSLIRALCIDRVTLSDALFEARSRVHGRDEGSGPVSKVGAKSSAQESSLLDIFENASVCTSTAPETRFLGLGNAAIQTWTRHMHELAENEPFARAVGMRPQTLREMIAEIAGGARRTKLAHLLAERMEKIIHIENTDVVVAKASLVCEREINRFVATLGYEAEPLHLRPLSPTRGEGPPCAVFERGPATYDCSGIGPQPVPFGFRYAVDWFAAFRQVVRDNASSEDGAIVDPEQNRMLGEILARLRGAPTRSAPNCTPS